MGELDRSIGVPSGSTELQALMNVVHDVESLISYTYFSDFGLQTPCFLLLHYSGSDTTTPPR